METAMKEQKQIKRREYLLSGNMWKVVISIALPMVFYNLCNYLYGIYDMMVVQSANIGDAADIVVLDQIKNMISTIGSALATGGGILVARRYGEKKTDEARKCANTLFSMALLVALVTLVFIPVGEPFLKLFKTDQSIIENSLGYYNVQIVTLVITTMNSTMISLEKAKGDTVHLLCLNLVVIVLKVGLTTLFVYGPFENVTNTWLAVSTLIAQLFLFFAGMFLCFRRKNILRIRIKELNFRRAEVINIIKLAVPVFVGNFLFSFGKVYVNAVATERYGKMCVGALGISNTIAGLLANINNSFADSGSVIVSQNYGNKNGERIKKLFKVNFIYVTAACAVGTVLLFMLKEPIAQFFAPGDLLYQEMIVAIFTWECLDLVFIGFGGVSNALFNGFGKTNITMIFSMLRLFAYRIPVLLFLMYVVEMDYTACGIAMFVSNFLSGAIEIVFATIFNGRMKKKYPGLFENKG